jgi:hypothetical protein
MADLKEMSLEDLQAFLDMSKSDPAYRKAGLRSARTASLGQTLAAPAADAAHTFMEAGLSPGIEPGKELVTIPRHPDAQHIDDFIKNDFGKQIASEAPYDAQKFANATLEAGEQVAPKAAQQVVPSVVQQVARPSLLSRFAPLAKRVAGVVGGELIGDIVLPTYAGEGSDKPPMSVVANPSKPSGQQPPTDDGPAEFLRPRLIGPFKRPPEDENNTPILKPSMFPLANVAPMEEKPDQITKTTSDGEDNTPLAVASKSTTIPSTQSVESKSAPEQATSSVQSLLSRFQDPELKQAQSDAASQRNMASMLAAIAKISSGLGAHATGKAPTAVDEKGFQAVGALGEQTPKDIITRREQARKLAEDSVTQQAMDPNSEISVAVATEMSKVLGKDYVGKVSAYEAEKLGFSKLVKEKQEAAYRAAQRSEDRAFKRDLFDQKLSQDQTRQADLNTQRTVARKRSAVAEYKNNDKYRMGNKAEIAVANAESALDLKNPIADSAILRQLARMSGEVGTMTDQDVNAFGGSQAIESQIEQYIKRKSDGTLTEENRKYMTDFIKAMKRNSARNKEEAAFEAAETAASIEGIDPAEALYYIVPGHPKAKAPEGTTFNSLKEPAQQVATPQVDKDVQDYATKHGITVEQAQAIKAKRMSGVK